MIPAKAPSPAIIAFLIAFVAFIEVRSLWVLGVFARAFWKKGQAAKFVLAAAVVLFCTCLEIAILRGLVYGIEASRCGLMSWSGLQSSPVCPLFSVPLRPGAAVDNHRVPKVLSRNVR